MAIVMAAVGFVLAGMLMMGSAGCFGSEAPARESLGRQAKLRILVDKVMQPQEGWVTKEWMVREAAEAGFNVLSPRRGHENLDEVRQVAEWCRQYGIYYMPWMRGTLTAPNGPEANGKRLVWASGNEQPLYSPNADEFWQWTERYILEYARIARQNRSLMGVFLDYENYAPGKEGNCYDLSYDDIILQKFAKAKGMELPPLERAKRKSWLVERGLHEEFRAFQINHWRERCRTLRQAIDAIDPTFQFCIYPAPGTLFMVEACYPEWATQQAPLILADPYVYGRPSRFLPQAEALEGNRQKLLRNMEVPKKAGIPFIYAGGIDPAVAGADPEFSGKNAVMICDTTDGYWIFYEGPTYTKQDHRDYWKWFTWANKAIAAGNWKAWQEPRETPEDFSLGAFQTDVGKALAADAEAIGKKVQLSAVRLRRENLLLLACRAGQPVEVELRNHPVGQNTSLLIWEVRNPTMALLASGNIPHNQTGTVRFTPQTDGLYLLRASAGSCAYSVVSANVPVGIFAGEGASFILAAERLYFRVPPELKEFTITVRGGGGAETVRLNVRDPQGQVVASGQTTRQTPSVRVTVPVGARGGTVWSLEATRADEGVLEDYQIALDSRLSPVLSLSPEHVYRRNTP